MTGQNDYRNYKNLTINTELGLFFFIKPENRKKQTVAWIRRTSSEKAETFAEHLET